MNDLSRTSTPWILRIPPKYPITTSLSFKPYVFLNSNTFCSSISGMEDAFEITKIFLSEIPRDT